MEPSRAIILTYLLLSFISSPFHLPSTYFLIFSFYFLLISLYYWLLSHHLPHALLLNVGFTVFCEQTDLQKQGIVQGIPLPRFIQSFLRNEYKRLYRESFFLGSCYTTATGRPGNRQTANNRCSRTYTVSSVVEVTIRTGHGWFKFYFCDGNRPNHGITLSVERLLKVLCVCVHHDCLCGVLGHVDLCCLDLCEFYRVPAYNVIKGGPNLVQVKNMIQTLKIFFK